MIDISGSLSITARAGDDLTQGLIVSDSDSKGTSIVAARKQYGAEGRTKQCEFL